MTNTTDNIVGFAVKPRGRCRVAYTLNDAQPVICTIIGDQPLFYMDYEESDDAALDEAFGLDDIEAGIRSLQEKISELEKPFSFDDEAAGGRDFNYFLSDADFVLRPGRVKTAPTTEALESVLRQSRLAVAYLDFAAQHGSALRYSAQTDTGFYDRRSGDIFINPHLGDGEQVLLAARELRRLWQHRNGALLHPLTFHPDQAILVNRAQAADLAVNMVRIAWELQLAGEREAWDRIEFSSMADLARTFARESFIDFRTLNNGVAASAVFECWFLSERCSGEDKKLIQQMLADYSGYVFENPQASQNVTADLIFALGSMPFGKNYLAPYVRTIMGDPVFTEVRDRSNANFLWFIKFERSFRETERELQTEKSINSPGDRQGDSNKNKRWIGSDEKTAEIITLERQDDKATAARANTGKRRKARIVDFRQSPGEQGG